jgi:hypothetical protein
MDEIRVMPVPSHHNLPRFAQKELALRLRLIVSLWPASEHLLDIIEERLRGAPTREQVLRSGEVAKW